MRDISELFPGAAPDRLRRVFERTEVKRSPIVGIVKGYHTLPFSLVGPDDARAPEDAESGEGVPSRRSVLLTGKISVSPRLVLPVGPDGRVRGFGSRRHYCFRSPDYRRETERIVGALAERYGGHEGVVVRARHHELPRRKQKTGAPSRIELAALARRHEGVVPASGDDAGHGSR